MTPKKVQWGRLQLEFSDDRFRLRIAGSPRGDAFLFGLLGVSIWCIFCIPMLVMGARVSPWLYVITGIIPAGCIGMGFAIGRNAQDSGFVASRKPTAGISTLQGGQAIVIAAEDIREFVTKQRDATIGGRSVTLTSLVAVTQRGEFVLIPEMLINKKGSEVFSRVLSSLLLGHGSFEVVVRQALEVRRRDLMLFGVFVGVLLILLVVGAVFFIRHI